MAQMKEQNSRKITKQNEDKQSIRHRVEDTGYKDTQGIQQGPKQHKKKIQSEMKGILTEMKNNL